MPGPSRSNLTRLTKSQLRGEGQYGIGECYEDMAKAARGARGNVRTRVSGVQGRFRSTPRERPCRGCGRQDGEFLLSEKGLWRAVDVFEKVLSDHPDANFLDVILFNYGRCLFRLDRRAEARKRFDQLIDEFPESQLAPEAKRISQALAKSGF